MENISYLYIQILKKKKKKKEKYEKSPVSSLEESWKQIFMKIPTSSLIFLNIGSKTKVKKSAVVAAQPPSWEGAILDYDLSSLSCLWVFH